MADSKYSWTGPEVDGKDTGLPFPTGDSPPKAPEQIQKLADSIAIYGTSRPDTDSQYDDAPVGTQYIFSGNQAQLDAVFGARAWRKTPSSWVCVDGDTDMQQYTSPDPELNGTVVIRRTNATQYVWFTIDLAVDLSSPFTKELAAILPANTTWNIGHTTGHAHFDFGVLTRASAEQVGVARYQHYLLASGNPRDTIGVTSTPGANISDAAVKRVTVTATAVGAPWPTGERGDLVPARSIQEIKADIEQAEKNNPELAEQLRQELKALKSEGTE